MKTQYIFIIAFVLLSSITLEAEEHFITDKKHNIQWQDSDEKEIVKWKLARAYCSNLVWNGDDDWRLPTKEELVSLSNHNHIQFKYLKENIFWTSENDPDDHFNAITVYSGNGFVAVSDKCEDYATVCVREYK